MLLAQVSSEVSQLMSQTWYYQWGVTILFSVLITIICFKNPKRSNDT